MEIKRILIGEINDSEITSRISLRINSLQGALRSQLSTKPVVEFVEVEDFPDIFENKGADVLQRYERHLADKLDMTENLIDRHTLSAVIPRLVEEFKNGINLLKREYDEVLSFLPKEAIIITKSESISGFNVEVDSGMLDKVVKNNTQVFTETPEQLRLYELCQQVCGLCDEIIAMRKPSLNLPTPLRLFTYKDVFGQGRKTIIDVNNLNEYFKNI